MKLFITFLIVVVIAGFLFVPQKIAAMDDVILHVVLRNANRVRYSLFNGAPMTTMDGSRIMTMEGR